MNLPFNTDSEDRLAALLLEVWDEVIAYANRRLSHDPQQVEDFVQDAAADLVCWWSRHGEVGRHEAVAKLKHSIKCDVADLRRSQGRRLTSLVAVDDQVLLDYLDQTKDPEHEILALLARIDDQQLVLHLLATLDERQREAIVAVYIDGTTQQQAATDIGITVRALQYRLNKALTQLRKALTQLRRQVTSGEPQNPITTIGQRTREIPR